MSSLVLSEDIADPPPPPPPLGLEKLKNLMGKSETLHSPSTLRTPNHPNLSNPSTCTNRSLNKRSLFQKFPRTISATLARTASFRKLNQNPSSLMMKRSTSCSSLQQQQQDQQSQSSSHSSGSEGGDGGGEGTMRRNRRTSSSSGSMSTLLTRKFGGNASMSSAGDIKKRFPDFYISGSTATGGASSINSSENSEEFSERIRQEIMLNRGYNKLDQHERFRNYATASTIGGGSEHRNYDGCKYIYLFINIIYNYFSKM